MGLEFRKLRADEIDCRVAMIRKNGLSLLLYKDARVDMRILDETVGADSWQREHELINGNLFCNVGIYFPDRGGWVWKQDVGTESNTEKEKGQASDSFKRACFNWGIGRELYSAPFIWISSDKYEADESRGGNPVCKDRFEVAEIGYSDRGDINRLVIKNATRKTEVFRMGGRAAQKVTQDTPQAPVNAPQAPQSARKALIDDINALAKEKGYSAIQGLETATEKQLAATLKKLQVAQKKGETA